MLTSEEALIAAEVAERWKTDNFIWIDDEKAWPDEDYNEPENAIQAAYRLRTGKADVADG